MNQPDPAPLSKDLIAASAKRMFEEQGFNGITVRGIAADAGVDPSLVIRHFGSKEALFLKVLGMDEYVRPPIEGPIEELGQRLAGFVLAHERQEFRSHFATMIRASDREAIRDGLRATVRRMFLDDLVEVLPGRDRYVRALLIGTQIGGLMQSAAMIDEEVLPEIGRDRLIEMYGHAIQSLVDFA